MVDTNAKRTLAVCATPQNSDLDAAGFAALTYVAITGVGALGATGPATNLLNYPTWDTTVTQKAKGLTNAGDPQLEVARKPTDAGQVLLRSMGDPANNNSYAFKMTHPDGSVVYNRGLVVGPLHPNGRNEDFNLEQFNLGLNQLEVVINPVVGNAPVNTVIPTISGTPKVATVMTVANGTWTGDATITYTYQWLLNGVAVPGATANTYTPVVGDIGKVPTCRVTGTNGAGSISAQTAPAAAIIA